MRFICTMDGGRLKLGILGTLRPPAPTLGGVFGFRPSIWRESFNGFHWLWILKVSEWKSLCLFLLLYIVHNNSLLSPHLCFGGPSWATWVGLRESTILHQHFENITECYSTCFLFLVLYLYFIDLHWIVMIVSNAAMAWDSRLFSSYIYLLIGYQSI